MLWKGHCGSPAHTHVTLFVLLQAGTRLMPSGPTESGRLRIQALLATVFWQAALLDVITFWHLAACSAQRNITSYLVRTPWPKGIRSSSSEMCWRSRILRGPLLGSLSEMARSILRFTSCERSRSRFISVLDAYNTQRVRSPAIPSRAP